MSLARIASAIALVATHLSAAAADPGAQALRVLPVPELYRGDHLRVAVAIETDAGGVVQIYGRPPGGKIGPLLQAEVEPQGKRSQAVRLPMLDSLEVLVLETPGHHEVQAVLVGAGVEPLAAADSWVEIVAHHFGPEARPELLVPTTFVVRDQERPATEKLPLVDGILDGADNPTFLSGSTRLAASGDYRTLWRWARLIKSPGHWHERFLVECHADNRGEHQTNLELSEQRARAMVDYLVRKCGVPSEQLLAVGKGDFEPLADSSEATALKQNRRVVLAVDNLGGARR